MRRPASRVSGPTIAALLNLLGPPASIGGNEIAAGRRVRVVRLIMTSSAVLAIAAGFAAYGRPAVAIAVLAVYVVAIMADSAAMTAGLIEVSPPEARGTAMAMYSFFGFGGAFDGPIAFGALLDAGGGEAAPRAWLLAFGGLAAVGLAGVAVLRDGASGIASEPRERSEPAQRRASERGGVRGGSPSGLFRVAQWGLGFSRQLRRSVSCAETPPVDAVWSDTLPPRSSASSRTIARPRPEPGRLRRRGRRAAAPRRNAGSIRARRLPLGLRCSVRRRTQLRPARG